MIHVNLIICSNAIPLTVDDEFRNGFFRCNVNPAFQVDKGVAAVLAREFNGTEWLGHFVFKLCEGFQAIDRCDVWVELVSIDSVSTDLLFELEFCLSVDVEASFVVVVSEVLGFLRFIRSVIVLVNHVLHFIVHELGVFERLEVEVIVRLCAVERELSFAFLLVFRNAHTDLSNIRKYNVLKRVIKQI